MSNNKQSIVEDLAYWKNNAEENYITTPISVLKYITELENYIEIIKAQLPSDEEIIDKSKQEPDNSDIETAARIGYVAGAKWMRNKIQGGNK